MKDGYESHSQNYVTNNSNGWNHRINHVSMKGFFIIVTRNVNEMKIFRSARKVRFAIF